MYILVGSVKFSSTVFHCHVHLIHKRKGDMDEPKGGVRGVIPNKRTY